MTAVPRLDMFEVDGRVRLTLGGLTQAEGTTLQEVADDVVRRVLLIAMTFRATGIGTISSEWPRDFA
jgi:hypothetical protein